MKLLSKTVSVFILFFILSCSKNIDILSVKVPVIDKSTNINNIKISGENRIIFMNVTDADIVNNLKSNNFDTLLKKLESQNSNDDNIIFNKSALYYFLNDIKGAINGYETLIIKKYNLSKTYNNLAVCYGSLGDYNKAIEYYQKSLDIDKSLSYVYQNIGLENKINNKLDIALENYNKSIEINSKDSNSYYSRANIYYLTGDFDKALNDYSKAIEINSDNPYFYNNRAVTSGQKNEIYESSIKDYTKAIELKSNYIDAYYNRGIIYINLALYNEAITDFEKVISLNPDNFEAYYYLGNAYFNKSDYESAIKNYTKLLELRPNFEKGYNNRGSAYALIRDFTNAIKDFSKLIELTPNDFEAYSYRADSYFQIGKKEGYLLAIKDYTKSMSLKENPKLYLNRGSSYANISEFENSITDFSRYIEVFPQDPDAYYYRALAYIEINQKDKYNSDLLTACKLGKSQACISNQNTTNSGTEIN